MADTHHIFEGSFQLPDLRWSGWRVVVAISPVGGGKVIESNLDVLFESIYLPGGDRIQALHHLMIATAAKYETDEIEATTLTDARKIVSGMIRIWLNDMQDLQGTSAVGEEIVGARKCVIVESMTGDAPDQWLQIWERLGYSAIHFIGNGCDHYTDMNQQPFEQHTTRHDDEA